MKKQQTNHFETECILRCTDNDRTMEATIEQFREEESLTVIVKGKVRLHLRYTKFKEYVGSMAGLEFVTKGPRFLGSSFR